jgi:valyl-tRNA synthetase
MTDLQERTRWEPAEAEAPIFERWLESGLFHVEPEGTAEENFSIAIPPPNVTGALHMGHALNGSVQDCLIRYNRMLGRRTRWTLGTDHAGIATQTQVERLLRREGTSREEIGRAAFIERVWQWREQYGGIIFKQFQRLGASCDYGEERFTLDPSYVSAVMKVFVDLHRKGLIYRDNRIVNWDPGSRSAISDLEVEEREVTDTLYYVDYPLASGRGSLTVATVRPETMLADTAIAVHPDDERYTRLVGETAILPIVGRRLRIIADEYVKPEFGTGALKITPGHDPNDFEIGREHGLDEIVVIGEDGRMDEAAGERFAGMTALEAREAVVAELREQGAIVRTEPYTHAVPYSHRSGERIEPLISLQWFMAMEDLARPAIEAVHDGSLRVHPESQRKRYLDWLGAIRPWCISRQLWWGHQIPVWYRGEGETYVGEEPPEGDGWERDPDVLDTWFSSGLWPFATLGWPDETPELRAFYPTDVLSTGRDILFLWVARMVMLGIEFTGRVPFSDVYNHSTILAPDGRRMSKSLGTGIDPLDVIDKHGADGTRFGLLAMSSTQDVRFSEEKVAQGRQLANKLFNASRLVLLRVPDEAAEGDAGDEAAKRRGRIELGTEPPPPAAVEDAWILSRLQRAKAETARAIEAFEFHRAALGLYDFVYGELCDWYLEIVKPRLYDDDDEDVARFALHVLAETLAIAHPVIPFVTEAIWSHVPGDEGLLMGHRWPAADVSLIDPDAEAEVGRAIAAVQELRGWRDRVGAAPGAVLPARLEAGGYERMAAHVARLARCEWVFDGSEPVATVAVPGGTIAVLGSDAVDLGAAARRIDERRGWLDAEIERAERKLDNQGFVAKAPEAVVRAERDKLARLREERDGL